MKEKLAIAKVGQIIILGVPFISILVVTGVVTEPVNATKLAALGTLALPILLLLISRARKQLLSVNLPIAAVSLVFVCASVIAMVASNSPLTQNVYGVYGRSTGFLAYFGFTVFMLGTATLNQVHYFNRILKGFLFTGVVNVAYCAWVIVFGDFIGWNNPYKAILGLFGNPNFIGAFLGMFFVATFAVILQPQLGFKWRLLGISLMPITFYEILKSRAIQGLVVTAGGLALVGLLYLWFRKVKTIWIILYSFAFLVLASTAILGALQKGPLSFIYKRSVSFRGTYWESGIWMGLHKPFTGVGMDSYGDWYRRARPPRALVDTPGIETVTNAAHNVFFDLFSYGGFPLLISYFAILGLAIRSILRILRRRTEYDAIFVSIALVWTCYQIQSIISINQIGLAIWGWVFTGALIGYERVTREFTESESSKSKKLPKLFPKESISNEAISSNLLAGIGLALGLIIAIPPVSADKKWWDALQSRSLVRIENSLTPSYFNPSNSQKYAQAVDLFKNNKLPDLALKYSRAAVKFNPEDFTSWFQLYGLSNSTVSEKEEAVKNMKRLDPLNPDVTKP